MIQSKYRYNLSYNIDIDYGCIKKQFSLAWKIIVKIVTLPILVLNDANFG